MIAFVLFLASAAVAQTVSSAANSSIGLAPGSLASIYGHNLAPIEEVTRDTPWPLTLGRIRAQVTDSAGATRAAGLLYASPTQVNLQIPVETAPGAATVTILNGASPVSVSTEIHAIAPALFTVNDSGIASASAVRVVMPSLDKTTVALYHCAGRLPSSCALDPIAQALNTVVYISLYATGIRGLSSLENVFVNINDQQISPTYAGPDYVYPGRDRVDFPLPRSLHGEARISVTVDGVTSNPVRLRVQ